jgi:Dolichyl-phosphate-mannose-protein mannosyltransferase
VAVSTLTQNAEVAGRTISIVAGSLVVFPVHLIARFMYGPSLAIGAAALVGLHPYLIQLSTTVFSEPTYLTIVLTAIYTALRAMDGPTPQRLLFCGVLYGLAYLARPEALSYMVVATVFLTAHIAITGANRRRALLLRVLILPVGFALLAGPYVAWLSMETGHVILQGKSSFNIPTEQRMQQGLSEYAAAFEIAPDLTPRGTWMQSSLAAIQNNTVKTSELPALLMKRAKAVLRYDVETISRASQFGSLSLFALAFAGLFARPWRVHLAVAQAHIALLLALVPVGQLFTYNFQERFLILFVPFMCIWAAMGVALLARWARGTWTALGFNRLYRSGASRAVSAIAVAAVIAPSAASALKQLTADRSSREIKEIIIDLAASRSAPMRIAATWTPPAFEAGADFVWLPFADELTARRFLTKSGVTHVVLRGTDAVLQLPYQRKWIEDGVPDAHSIVDTRLSTGERLAIYQLAR